MSDPFPPVAAVTTPAVEAECHRLVIRYGRCIDLYDDEGVLALFTPDAVWRRPGQPPLNGHEPIRRFLASRDRTILMRHVMSNFQLESFNGDRATGVSYWTGYVAKGTPQDGVASARAPFSVGEYLDEYRRTDAGWRIASRTARYVFRDPA